MLRIEKKNWLVLLLLFSIFFEGFAAKNPILERLVEPVFENSVAKSLVYYAAAKRKKKRKSQPKSNRRKKGKRNRRHVAVEKPELEAQLLQQEAQAEAPKQERGKVDVQLEINSEDGIFWDSTISITLIPQFDIRPSYDSVFVRLTLRSDSLSSKVHWDTTATIEVGDEINFKFRAREPGFYWVQSELYHNRKLMAFKQKKIGYQPQWFFPAFTPPADMMAFWEHARIELNDIKEETTTKKGPQHRWPTVDVFSVSIPSTDGVLLHAWLTIPKSPGRHPVILELPPYGSGMKPDLETRDLAVLRLDVRGHGKSKKQINPGFPGFMTFGLPEEDTYIYKGVMQDCLAAVRYLKSLPNIDPNRIGVMGISQGGGLASMVSCLDSSIKAMAVSVPFMCNWSRYFVTAPWPKRDFQQWINQDPYNRKMDKVLKTLSYFDPANLTIGCKAKIFLAVGLQDMTCPPDGAFAWYNTMMQTKEIVVYKDGNHILPGVRGKMMYFMRQQLKGY